MLSLIVWAMTPSMVSKIWRRSQPIEESREGPLFSAHLGPELPFNDLVHGINQSVKWLMRIGGAPLWNINLEPLATHIARTIRWRRERCHCTKRLQFCLKPDMITANCSGPRFVLILIKHFQSRSGVQLSPSILARVGNLSHSVPQRPRELGQVLTHYTGPITKLPILSHLNISSRRNIY